MRLVLLFLMFGLVGGKILGQRDKVSLDWEMREPDLKTEIEFLIQLEYDSKPLVDYLALVSDPHSKLYGQYLNFEQIKNLIILPALDSIYVWLNSQSSVSTQTYMDSILVRASIESIQNLFKTRMMIYKHMSGQSLIKTWGSFSIPDHLPIKHVFGLSELIFRKERPNPQLSQDILITPEILRSEYNISSNLRSSIATGIYAYMQYPDPQALDIACKKAQLPNTKCSIAKYIGFDCLTSNYSSSCLNQEFEAQLDVEVVNLMASFDQSPGSGAWFWESSNNYDESVWMLAWAQQVNAQTSSDVPLVYSISYGAPEPYQCLGDPACQAFGYDSQAYIDATDLEFLKMGLRGWTVVVAAGDDGASSISGNYPVLPISSTVNQLILETVNISCVFPTGGRTSSCSDFLNKCSKEWLNYAQHPPTSCQIRINNPMMQPVNTFRNPSSMTSNCSLDQYPSWSQNGCSIYAYSYRPNLGYSFLPNYPASSPYVLSVGATQFQSNQEIVASSATKAVITSGGGFSLYHPRPSYQDRAVTSYLGTNNNLPPYFPSNNRAYPDITANGHNYATVFKMKDKFQILAVDGTSASCPLIASMISLWNSQLIANNKPPLGFFNPRLYQLLDVFNDIVEGNIACTNNKYQLCSQWSYYAQKGWDPASGMGSPNFGKILDVLLG